MADAPLPVPQDHSDPQSHVLKPLNERQHEFCKHYVMTKGNVLQSAILAGYAAGHGNTAHAYRLPDMPHVQAGIAYYRELFGAQMGYDRDKLLYELGLMASVDVTEMVDDDWQVIPKSKLSKEHCQAMVGLEVIQKSDSRTIRPRYAKLEAKKEIAERYIIRKRWWTQLIQRSAAINKLHAHITPGVASWIGVSSGVRGLNSPPHA